MDFPIPGSPPMSTIEPGTMPPPSTKSNSSIPVFHRSASEPSTVRSFGVSAMVPPSPKEVWPPIRRAAPMPFAVVALGVAISSVSVLHSPQASQRPAHFGYSAPQLVQR